MRKFSMFLTVLITSFVMALAGLVASPIASASENGNGSISATFPLGSSVLSDAQKAAIKKTVASSGSDVSFIVTGTAGKLPGVRDRWVQRLAKKRAQAIKAYLVSLGVSKENVTTQTKTTEIGIVPKSIGSYPTSASTVAVTNSAGTGSGSSSGGSSGGGSGSGGGGTPSTVVGAPTSVSATVGNLRSVVSWTAPASDGGAAIIDYTVTSNPGAKTCTGVAHTCTVLALTNGTPYTFTVTARNSVGLSPASTASSSITPAITYAVGDAGPGGGIVFYVNSVGFNCGPLHSATGSPTSGLCKYLEVAPNNWNSGGDALMLWAVLANNASDIADITDAGSPYSNTNNASQIGLGYKNSVAIVAQNGAAYDAVSNKYAAGAARAYTITRSSVTYSDWYLPTAAELNQLCQWNQGQTVTIRTTVCGNSGNHNSSNYGANAAAFTLAANPYWSSSEGDGSNAWTQRVDTGAQVSTAKGPSDFSRVRPIRAF